jgi:glycosyltransferase involved in cell wall biosynthesis
MPQQAYGGLQQVVAGLAWGLSMLDGDDRYLLLGFEDSAEWLGEYVAGPCEIVTVPRGTGRSRRRRAFESLSAASPRIGSAVQRLGPAFGNAAAPTPRADGLLEALGADLVHFTSQQGFLTAVPSIYQVHDLQHVHRPDMLTRMQVIYRERAYRAFCGQAAIVAVMTEWGRADVCKWSGLPPEKIAVVPWAPAPGLRLDLDVQHSSPIHDLPDRFLLYPAQTWPHKNHLRLVAAMALLRDRGLDLTVVCTGRLNEHYAAIRRRVTELHLSDQMQFLGWVSDAELKALYQRATALVFPSLFEGWGLPLVEAFALGLPVAASNAAALPETAGDAAVLFDPERPEEIADAIARIWTDEALRSVLADYGRRRAATLSWERTARTYRALYRKVAGRILSEEDRVLLAPPTLLA